MSRTFHACPVCGQSTTNSGPCASCIEKQRLADKTHHMAMGLGWLYIAWLTRKPLFWFLMLATAFVGFQILHFQGQSAAQVWGVPRGVATLGFAGLFATTLTLKVHQRSWVRRVSGKVNQNFYWGLINVGLTLLLLLLGLPTIIGGIWLADTTLPPESRMLKTGPLWPSNEILLSVLPLCTGVMLLGSL